MYKRTFDDTQTCHGTLPAKMSLEHSKQKTKQPFFIHWKLEIGLLDYKRENSTLSFLSLYIYLCFSLLFFFSKLLVL